MLTWLREFLYDKSVFMGSLRWLVAALGIAVDKGWVPTGIDHGHQVGLLISAFALSILPRNRGDSVEGKKGLAHDP